jgi:hypothetical protein
MMQTSLHWRLFLVVIAIELKSRIRERDGASLAATLSRAAYGKK